LKIKSEPAIINARVLPTPQVQYHQSSKQQGLLTPQNGVWNLVGQKVCAGAELGSWAVVCFCPQRNMGSPAIEAFVKELCTGVPSSLSSLIIDDCSQSQSSCHVCKLQHRWRRVDPSRGVHQGWECCQGTTSTHRLHLADYWGMSSHFISNGRPLCMVRSNVSPIPSLEFLLNATKYLHLLRYLTPR
jgi:hypothetical protein